MMHATEMLHEIRVGLAGMPRRRDLKGQAIGGLGSQVLAKDSERHDQAVVVTGLDRDYSLGLADQRLDGLSLDGHPVRQGVGEVADKG